MALLIYYIAVIIHIPVSFAYATGKILCDYHEACTGFPDKLAVGAVVISMDNLCICGNKTRI